MIQDNRQSYVTLHLSSDKNVTMYENMVIHIYIYIYIFKHNLISISANTFEHKHIIHIFICLGIYRKLVNVQTTNQNLSKFWNLERPRGFRISFRSFFMFSLCGPSSAAWGRWDTKLQFSGVLKHWARAPLVSHKLDTQLQKISKLIFKSKKNATYKLPCQRIRITI